MSEREIQLNVNNLVKIILELELISVKMSLLCKQTSKVSDL